MMTSVVHISKKGKLQKTVESLNVFSQIEVEQDGNKGREAFSFKEV